MQAAALQDDHIPTSVVGFAKQKPEGLKRNSYPFCLSQPLSHGLRRASSPCGEPFWCGANSNQKLSPQAGKVDGLVCDGWSKPQAVPAGGESGHERSEWPKGERLGDAKCRDMFPLSHGLRRDTNAGWNMVVLLRCRLQYSLFRPILPSLHRPLGALGSNPP